MSLVLTDTRRAVRDVAPLVGLRLAGLTARGRRGVRTAVVAVVTVTGAASVLPAFLPGASDSPRAEDLLGLLPTVYAAFLVMTTLAVVGTGGGRELLSREQAVAFPISPTTDHLGALILAPLSIAWILQAWALLGVTAYVMGPHLLAMVHIVAVGWLLASTAVGQAVGWAVEWVRRGRYGVAIVRSVGALLLALAAAGVAADRLGTLVDHLPTTWIVPVLTAPAHGSWVTWALGVAVLAAVASLVVVVGAQLASEVAHRPPYGEVRVEGLTVVPRPFPRSELAALVRIDRASVWRSVPVRRGFLVLALLPGLAAAGSALPWAVLPVLPGLVAAGGALLFGVNAWCLDGVGALWRESLPVQPRLAYLARARVLFEVLSASTVLTLLVAGLRADGAPSSAEAGALLASVVVVPLQVAARSMQWSVRRPHASDLRSARGTPAPPSAMLGYSTWLAISSTLTGSLFSATSHATDPTWALGCALLLVLVAVRRLVITAREWDDPDVRARVVTTVATG